jgi:putative mRNA 3-end processing factor
MTDPTVKLRDGLDIRVDGALRVVADATAPDGDVALLSHAHGDHLYRDPPAAMVCSETTAALAAHRREARPRVVDHPRIDLVDAGHIPGSRAAVIEGERTVCYTGDVSLRDRLFLSGFEPPSADVLVIEATYGEPAYEFPPHGDEVARLEDWLGDTHDVPVVLFGYALGRAQELQRVVERTARPCYVTDAIRGINEVLAETAGLDLAGRPVADHEPTAGDVLVLPSQTSGLQWVADLVERSGALTAGASGWAVDSGFRYANGYDETFVLSDHADHGELLAIVDSVSPDVVYTTHGAVDALAAAITRTFGIEAHALKRNQRTLGEF